MRQGTRKQPTSSSSSSSSSSSFTHELRKDMLKAFIDTGVGLAARELDRFHLPQEKSAAKLEGLKCTLIRETDRHSMYYVRARVALLWRMRRERELGVALGPWVMPTGAGVYPEVFRRASSQMSRGRRGCIAVAETARMPRHPLTTA